MIPELGHFALVLALALGLIQSIVPMVGARQHDAALMRIGSSTALMQFVCVMISFLALIICYVTSDFSVATDAVGLQDHQRLGQPRGFHALVGSYFVALRCFGRSFRAQFANRSESARIVSTIVDRMY